MNTPDSKQSETQNTSIDVVYSARVTGLKLNLQKYIVAIINVGTFFQVAVKNKFQNSLKLQVKMMKEADTINLTMLLLITNMFSSRRRWKKR